MLKNLTFIFFALFFGVLALAHGDNNPPSWFLSQEKDNAFLYGNGSANTLEEAKKNAINDLASSIKLKVSSKTSIQNTQNNEEQQSKVLQNIQVSIESIELQNITFTHTQYKNKQYYAQVKISKKLLLNTFKEQYQNLYGQLSSFDTKCKSISINNKDKLQDLLSQANSLAQSIQALDFSQDLPSLLAYENLLNQNSPLVKAKIIFEDNKGKEITKALSSEYAKFFKSTDEDNVQTIQNKITIEKIDGKFTASLEANINDCNHQTMFFINIQATEDNKAMLLERLKVQLYKKLKTYEGGSVIPKIF